jgi:thioester reductase-like protein
MGETSRVTSDLLFTGFPGFLASALLPRVLLRAPHGRALCVVEPRFIELARVRLAAIERASPDLRGRIVVAAGDITAPQFGLPPARAEPIRSIFHLAAVYDLAVPRDVGLRVNLEGSRRVLEFATRCRRLDRLHYVSTCYVSGRTPGRFYEAELERGQSFNNHYEETKYLAEVEVRRAMAGGLPATIYRPSVVVGDHATGETQKYDGLYFVMQLLLRQPRLAVLPLPAAARQTRFNVVPRDFVVEAMAWLSALSRSAGVTYHLADPAPPTVEELVVALARATDRRLATLPVPFRLLRRLLGLGPVKRMARLPPEAADYLVHPTHYDTTHAQRDLEGSGLRVPRFDTYAARLVAFMREHPEPQQHG